MRVIIRFSLDADKSSALRNKLVSVLEGAGIMKQPNTATYEGLASPADIEAVQRAFWSTAAKHKGPGRVDHFWMYADSHATDFI